MVPVLAKLKRFIPNLNVLSIIKLKLGSVMIYFKCLNFVKMAPITPPDTRHARGRFYGESYVDMEYLSSR